MRSSIAESQYDYAGTNRITHFRALIPADFIEISGVVSAARDIYAVVQRGA
jgi:hypothetical protein